jgi:ethanolamine utilization protein EutN
MLIGRVVGNVIATQKNEMLEGAKLLLVQPLDLEGREKGTTVVAIDTLVDAGVGDRVLLVQEGKAAQAVLGRGTAAVDAAVVGVVDTVETSL